MDVLIPLGHQSEWDNNEIKFCLRSIERNLIDLERIFIIGYFPDFLIKGEKLIHIPCDDPFKHNKDANLIRKVIRGINTDISENFIRISDDQLFLKPILSKDIKPLYECDLKNHNWDNLNRWRSRLKNTAEILENEGKSIFKFDSHIPVVYNKKKFIEIFDRYIWDIEGGGYTINTIYFNNIEGEKIELTDLEKATFERPMNEIEIKKRIEGRQYLGYNDKGLNSELKLQLFYLFPNPSSYEVDSSISNKK